MDDSERRRRIARLALLGVPEAFRGAIAERPSPRWHNLMHAAIILSSIGLAILAIAVWSRLVDHLAESAARAAGARLFTSDLGLESLGGLFSVLFAAGWLCSWLTRRRGSEMARNGTAYDLMHEPARYKSIIDRLWRWMVAPHVEGAESADDFLDRLAGGMVGYLRLATITSLIATLVLAALVPAHYSLASDSAIEEHPMLPWSGATTWPIATARQVVTGCVTLPRDGNSLIYRLRFADGSEAELGSWQSPQGKPLPALVAIASRLPQTIASERFSNPIGNDPLSPDCLREFGGGPTSESLGELLRLLRLTEAEKASLHGRI